MIQNFNIFRNTKKQKDTQPDYLLSAKIGDKFVPIGSAWLNEKDGTKFFSVSLSKPYQDKCGYEIVPIEPNQKPQDAPGQ